MDQSEKSFIVSCGEWMEHSEQTWETAESFKVTLRVRTMRGLYSYVNATVNEPDRISTRENW